MRSVDFLKRLEGKEFFKEFRKLHPDQFLCAIFCILNKAETEGDKITLDFYVPSKNKIAYSESPFNEILFSEQENSSLSKLDDLNKISIDLEDLWSKVEEIQKDKKLNLNIGKIIGVLTKGSWNLTCISSSLELLKIKLDSFSGKVLDMKKEGLGDMIKIQKS